MSQVYVGIGSSIRRHHHIEAALEALSSTFGRLCLSAVFESDAVGFDCGRFFNLVVGFQTHLTVGQLSLTLKAIEDANGREREGSRHSPRTLDIDILIYDNLVGIVDGVTLPRKEITENAFVLWPLTHVAGDQLHPKRQVSYQQLWDDMPRHQQLNPIPFEWRGDCLTTSRLVTVNHADGTAE